MLGNYLTVALRSLAKSRSYTFINIFGLAVGLAAFLMILVHVRYELTYDRWLPNSERIYQLQTGIVFGPGREPNVSQTASYPAAKALQKDFPQIEKMLFLQFVLPDEILYRELRQKTDLLYTADSSLFDVLDLPLVEGDRRTAFSDTRSLLVTESKAKQLFGNRPPLGQVLTFKFGEALREYRVTGVLKDIPKNSHLPFELVGRFDPLRPTAELVPYLTDWHGNGGLAYLKLKPGAESESIIASLPAWKKRNEPPLDGPMRFDWRLVNVGDVHLGEAWGHRPLADRGFIRNLTIVGFLILAMACINFTNLATAHAGRRAREVALRKLLGATRRQLVFQFLTEAVLLTAFAMVSALAVIELLLPHLSLFLEADLALRYGDVGGTLLPILGLTLLVSLASGAYPAFYLSLFRPAHILKANASISEAPGSGRFRMILVVGQFAVSIGLIACTTIIYSQTVFGRTIDPGYQRAGLLQIENATYLGDNFDAFVREVGGMPGVRAVTRTSAAVGRDGFMRYDLTEPGMTEPLEVSVVNVDPASFETMGVELLAGRNFDAARGMDEIPPFSPVAKPDAEKPKPPASTNIIINETAAKRFGFKSPAAIVGKTLKFSIGPGATSTVVGVVEDVRLGSIRETVLPTAYLFQRDRWNSHVMLRYEGNPIAVRKSIEALWRRLLPQVPIVARFSEDVVQELYEKEESRGQLFGAFALIAVLISSLGLYGLAAFTADRRTKEIGIRKVLGARVRDIVRLLAWQFSKPVIAANLLAWPLAWWVMRDWLNGFDQRIDLTPVPFLLAGLLALGVAGATIAAHAFKAARANPVHALRYE